MPCSRNENSRIEVCESKKNSGGQLSRASSSGDGATGGEEVGQAARGPEGSKL